MTVGEILDKYDFSDQFLADFKEWCEKQPDNKDPVNTGSLIKYTILALPEESDEQ